MLSSDPARRQGSRHRPGLDRLRAIAFRALSGPGAPVYDRFTAWLFLGEWGRWQEAALSVLPQAGVVVELGAGTGALASRGRRPGLTWVGVEPSRSMLRVARRRGCAAGPRLVRATAQRLPIAAGVADAIVATFPAAFVVAPATASEMRRVLAPSGLVVVVLGGQLTGSDWRRRIRRAALRLFYGGSGNPAPPPFTLSGLEGTVSAMPTDHGFAWVYVGTPRTDY